MQFIETRDDPWHAPAGADAVGSTPSDVRAEAHLLMTPPIWLALRARWPSTLPVGLRLANDADPRDFAEDLARFALVELHFPKWVDGRAYSQAHLLRERYGYAGTIRATGDVVVDMMPLLQRTGFDEVVLREGQSIEAARRALGFFPAYYQGDVHEPLPLYARAAA